MILIICLAVPTGVIMLLWGLAGRATLPFAFGMANIAASAVCLLVWLALRNRSGRSGSLGEAPLTKADPGRAGMALLVSLMMLALLSGMALHALVSAGMNLRFARQRHTACLLRTAGTEAIWALLRETPLLQPDTLAHVDRTLTSGPGIETVTSMREVDRTALPPPLLLQNTPLFGRFFSITARITRDKDAREIQALACLMPTGEMRLLSWTEPF